MQTAQIPPDRLETLSTGRPGIRGSLQVDVRAVEGDEPLLDFIASDETLDRYQEVVRLDAWQLDEYRRNPVIIDSHDYSSVAKILGRSEDIAVKDGALVNRVRFALDNPMGAMAWKMSKAGFIRAESVGFYAIEWEPGRNADAPARTYTRANLIEVSLVPIPANPGAVRLALKSGAVDRTDIAAVIDHLRQLHDTRLSSSESTANPPGTGSAAAGDDHAAQKLERIARAIDTLHRTVRG